MSALTASNHNENIINMENINNVYANIEDIFYNYCINVPFKLINIPPNNMTSTISYAIKYILNVKDFIYSMREIIKKDFRISEFDIIINTQTENGLDLQQYLERLHSNRNIDSICVREIINSSTGFYVRLPRNQSDLPSSSSSPSIVPLQQLNGEECPVCYSLMRLHIRASYFRCSHAICNDCFTTWRNRNRTNTGGATCPLCRAGQH